MILGLVASRTRARQGPTGDWARAVHPSAAFTAERICSSVNGLVMTREMLAFRWAARSSSPAKPDISTTRSRVDREALLDQGDAVETRHLHVGDQDVETRGRRLQLLQRLRPVLRHSHLVTLEPQRALHQVPRCRVVLGQKDACHLAHRSFPHAARERQLAQGGAPTTCRKLSTDTRRGALRFSLSPFLQWGMGTDGAYGRGRPFSAITSRARSG